MIVSTSLRRHVVSFVFLSFSESLYAPSPSFPGVRMHGNGVRGWSNVFA